MQASTMRAALAALILILSSAIALPLAAQEGPPERLAQAGPPGGPGGGMGPRGRMHPGGWYHRWAQMTPQDRCAERYARQAGYRAYLEARLGLSAEQKLQWDRMAAASQAGAARERQLCLGFAGRPSDTIVERQERMLQMTAARLERLQATKPALEALYQTLSPEQRSVLDRPPRFGRR